VRTVPDGRPVLDRRGPGRPAGPAARIRSSINLIAAEHVALARHKERSVDTGLWCVYNAEKPVTWQI
jgi:hypothetical protein